MDLSRSVQETMCAEPEAAVTLRAPGRLHLGFLDPAGTLGRHFGSLGLVVDGFETQIELSAAPSQQIVAVGPAERAELERAAECLRLLQHHSGRNEPLRLRLQRVLPAHSGFGSGTQLALAIGRAFAQWHGLALSTPQLAQWLGRGARSGIGIAGFDQGGLLVDGGPGADGASAVVLSRIALPAAWRVIVVQHEAHQGLSGHAEKHAISTLPPLPQAQAADICHQVLMRVLPGAACAEFAPFAAGITHIQRVLGQHFAPAQGGAFTSPEVGRLIDWIERSAPHPVGVGQSSWGPTGFAIVPSKEQADACVAAARGAGVVGAGLAVSVVSGRNSGASVVDHRPSRATR
jgi:beta-ribofuranosylaminobenzene 5'-phosphate synthase